jgi:hypothetical protein
MNIVIRAEGMRHVCNSTASNRTWVQMHSLMSFWGINTINVSIFSNLFDDIRRL